MCRFVRTATRSSSSSSSLVSWEVEEENDTQRKHPTNIGIITLRSPKTYNALTVEMGNDFRKLIASLEQDFLDNDPSNKNSTVGAIVLCGEGDKAFSAGGDLKWLRSLSDHSVHANVDAMLSFYNSFLGFRGKLPVPVIAALHGPAVGAGACLALACDLRVGCSHPKLLGFPFCRLGIPPGMGAQHLLHSHCGMSASRTSELLLLGKTLTGEEASELGLLNHELVPSDAVKDTAKSLAKQILRTSHPVAVRSLIRSTRLEADKGLSDCLYKDAHAQAMCYRRSDWGEGLEAVATKRDPEFDAYHSQ